MQEQARTAITALYAEYGKWVDVGAYLLTQLKQNYPEDADVGAASLAASCCAVAKGRKRASYKILKGLGIWPERYRAEIVFRNAVELHYFRDAVGDKTLREWALASVDRQRAEQGSENWCEQ